MNFASVVAGQGSCSNSSCSMFLLGLLSGPCPTCRMRSPTHFLMIAAAQSGLISDVPSVLQARFAEARQMKHWF